MAKRKNTNRSTRQTRSAKKPAPTPDTKRDAEGMQFRSATIEVTRAEGDAPQVVNMSVSSETPVLTYTRYNGTYQSVYEILDHGEGSIDMSRCAEGLVIQDRHYGDQVGLMAVANSGRKLGGPVEFCCGQRAQDIEKDAAKGLRRNVSVGFRVDVESYVLEGEKDGIPVVRAMSWMPYEGSFEPIPADTNVGVGRSNSTHEGDTDKPTGQKPATTERDEMNLKELAAYLKRAAKHGISIDTATDLAEREDAAAALDSAIIDAQRVALDAAKAETEELRAAKPAKPAAPEGDGKRAAIGTTQKPLKDTKKARTYSLLSVFRHARGMKTDAFGRPVDIGMERELSDHCRAMGLGGSRSGDIFIPHAALCQRDFSVSGTSSASVETMLLENEFIDLLRAKLVVARAGVRIMSGLKGNIDIPKQTGASTGYWVAEGDDVTESEPTLGQVSGTPHTCGAVVDITRRMLMQSSPDAEMIVRDDILDVIAQTVEIAVFQGTGANGQPSAITNAAGINTPTVTQGTPTYLEMLGFPGAILADNADADGQKWIGTAEVWEKLAGTKKDAGSGEFVLNVDNNSMIGREFLPTENVGANSLFFGDWSKVILAIWGAGIDLNMDTASLSKSGGLRVVGLQDVDVMVRNGEALAYSAAVTGD